MDRRIPTFAAKNYGGVVHRIAVKAAFTRVREQYRLGLGADQDARQMAVDQLLECRPAAAALGAGPAAGCQLFDRRGAALDLTVDGVVGDRSAMAHVHVPQVRAT
jgi:hypothetical protein